MKMTNTISEAIKTTNTYNQDLIFDSYQKLLICMSPVTPATAEECWERFALTKENQHQNPYSMKNFQLMFLLNPI